MLATVGEGFGVLVRECDCERITGTRTRTRTSTYHEYHVRQKSEGSLRFWKNNSSPMLQAFERR